jgi:rod shape determining protein RodA
LRIALLGTTNFEILYGIGLAIYFMTHFIINIGMNLGIMPVTGITLPFMSYGGTAFATLSICMGILMSIQRNRKLVQT